MKLKFKSTIILIIIILAGSIQISAQININGKVVDLKNSDPLVGASVSVKGSTLGTATSVDGSFGLNVKQMPVKLLVSYIGYETRELTIENASSEITIQLTPKVNTMEDLIIVGSRGRPRTAV
ncbi:MAG TPA: carboxypeptidase-like regulatory domain-containing protein, partial [Prolixibacteraceae bacterium]|nr:carboxypeptidase-like regulatory domain-containing protein [Prolixibacteraceae bacterium]